MAEGERQPAYRPASPLAHLSTLSFECRFSTALGFASTPFFQVGLIRGLRIDAPPYIYQPLPSSLRHQSFKRSRNPDHPQSSTIILGHSQLGQIQREASFAWIPDLVKKHIIICLLQLIRHCSQYCSCSQISCSSFTLIICLVQLDYHYIQV